MKRKVKEKTALGKKIARLREAKDLSARALSIDLGYSEDYITHLENGDASPSFAILNAITQYFNIGLGDLFDDKTEYPIQYKELIEELNKLDSQELQKVIDFVKLITIHKK